MATATATAVAGSGQSGFADGPAAVVRFNSPEDVAVAPDGSYFVADCGNRRVRRVARDGAVTTVAGTGERGGTDGPGEVATFETPCGITVDRWGDVFVTEVFGHRIRRLARGGGGGGGGGGGWVVSTVNAAHGDSLPYPRGVAVDAAGHLVVAECGRHRVVRVDPATGALDAVAGHAWDGPGATAALSGPVGVAIDRRGDIFVADALGNRVRRIAAADGVVSTVAGSGVKGHVDGVGAAARLARPTAVVVDGRGVLVVNADGEFRLQRVEASADHAVTTVAWEPAGGPEEARIAGCAIDRDGCLIAATRGRILRVTGLGLVPPPAPAWSLREHRSHAAARPAVGAFVATVCLCAQRLDANCDAGAAADAAPRLPVEMWLAILPMLRPDQMLHA